MSYVHVFAGMDKSMDAVRLGAYLDATYNEDGDRLNSLFLDEVGITDYEPQAIESMIADVAAPLRRMVDGSSYLALWQAGLPEITARYVILVYARNVITRTDTTLVRYVGRFDFTIPKTNNPWD
jgi:hypothetical protein